MRYIYQNILDKTCFQHEMAYRNFKDLNRRTADNVLRDKAFNIATNSKYDGCGLASMANKYFDKKPSGSGIKMKIFLIKN